MKELKPFAKKKFNRLLRLLNHFPAGQEKEELHQIRPEIKKIKALLRLVHFNDTDFGNHKYYIPFRTIFREAGKIRDDGLRQELLDQYTAIHSPILQSSDQVIAEFTSQINRPIKVVRKKKKILLKKIALIKSHTFNLYLIKKNEELNDFLSDRFKQSDLHLLRKLIKEIIYLTSVKKKKSKIDPFLTESDKLIGSWHDKQVLIPWIRANIPKEKETINQLKSESNSDLQKLKKIIQDR